MKLTSVFSLKPSIFWCVFKAALVVTFFLITNENSLVRLEQIVGGNRYTILLAYGGIWAAAVLAVLIVALIPRTSLRVIWAALISLSAFVGDSFFQIVGEFINFDYVELFWVARSETGNMLAAYGDKLTWPLVRAVFGFVVISLPPPKFPKIWNGRSWLAGAPLVPIAMIGGAVVFTGGYGTEGLPQQFTPLTISTLVIGYTVSTDLDKGREEILIPVTQPGQVKNIVLIVDESVRGDFLGINGMAGTTPYLLSQGRRLSNFGLSVSGSNCSHFSNAILRLGGTRENLREDIMASPYLWKYAKKAGYRTVYIDGQHPGDGKRAFLQNFLSYAELNYIDDFVQFGEDVLKADLRIAAYLRKVLSQPQPHFIYVNKTGSHFKYDDFYPADRVFFKPHMAPDEKIGESRERLINSYKNGLRWSVNHFFETFLKDLDLTDTVILYTSDHGQNLMDQGTVTHCRYKNPFPGEGIVPMVALTEHAELLGRFKQAAKVNLNKTSHFNIFPTILNLFGFDGKQIQARYGASLFDTVTAEQAFTAGTVFRRFGEKIKWIPVGDFIQKLIKAREKTQHAIPSAQSN